MSTESNQPENDFSVVEELTAYLDGELDEVEIQRVEMRLGEDNAYRAEMQSLQKTWDLLDELPTTEPGASFTKTTMELVVGEAVNLEKRRRNRSWVWPGRIAIILGLPVILFASAFGVIRKFQSGPDRLLIENLSVIEHHSRYNSIDCDLDFLQRLSDQALFSASTMFVDDGDSVIEIYESEEPDLIPTDVDQRKTYVESLDVQKKLKLKRKLEDFQNKTEPEKQWLREFDDQLTGSENRARLTATLTAYYDWLLKLDSGERSDLRDMAADERIGSIRKIRSRQAVEEFGKTAMARLPSQEDAEFILGWCENVFRLKEKQIRDHFSTAFIQYAKDHNRRVPPEDYVRRKSRYGNLHSIVGFLIGADRQFVEDLILDNREMYMLYDLLSTKARSQLDDRTPAERRDLILDWVELASQSQRGISNAALIQFERRLSVKERDRLEKMSSEDYRETLKRMFIEQRKTRNVSQSGWEQELDEWEQELEGILSGDGN